MVGLEDRDWYRDEPSRAWRDDRAARSPSRPSWGGPAVHRGAALAIFVSVVATAVTWELDVLQLQAPAPATSAVPPPTLARPSNQVRLTPTPQLGTRVDRDTIWTLTDSRFGRLSVVVPAGRTPLSVIARELTARGYQVTLPATLGRR